MWPSALQVENHILHHCLWAEPWKKLSLEGVELPLFPKQVNNVTLTNALKLNGYIGIPIVLSLFTNRGQSRD
jgi:hypothetical protein